MDDVLAVARRRHASGSTLAVLHGADCLSLSPDGRYGVRRSVRSDSDSRIDLVVFDLQTKEIRNLTNGQFGGYNEYPTWSPTGEWIVWGSNKDNGGGKASGRRTSGRSARTAPARRRSSRAGA